MKISHHLDDATLMSFSAGNLSEPLAAVVSAHLELCPSCSQRLATMQAIGGALISGVEPAAMTTGAFDKVLAAAKSDDNVRVFPRRKRSSYDGALPQSLAEHVGDLDDVNWKFLAPGVRYAPLELSDPSAGDLRLLRIEPGRKMPDHGHHGAELTLVLRGSYSDETGTYGAGDVADLDEDVEHQPIVGEGEACICLVASERPARFKSLLGRMAQPFVGM